MRAVFWPAFGAFAIGTQSFMVAGLLPVLAADLAISVATAGQLLTVYALTYAIGAPILATLFGAADRRRLLIAGLAVFALTALLAAAAQNFAQLVLANIVLALAAGLFLPTAYAAAVALAAPGQSGRAVAIVTGGGTVAVAAGVPLGTWIASAGQWRLTFVLVGILSLLATLALAYRLPRTLPGIQAPLAERLAVARQPGVLRALIGTVLWASGGFTFFTYVSPFFTEALGIGTGSLSAILFLIGVAAALGTALGGYATDRAGALPVVYACVAALVIVLSGLSFAATLLPVSVALPACIVLVALWAIVGWGFGPAQATRIIALVPEVASVALALNASAIYVGIAAGAALGALTIETLGLTAIGWVGASCQLAGFGLLLLSARRHAAGIFRIAA